MQPTNLEITKGWLIEVKIKNKIKRTNYLKKNRGEEVY